MAAQRTVYRPTLEEQLEVLREVQDIAEYYDYIGKLVEDEEENQYARALGYQPESSSPNAGMSIEATALAEE